MALLGKRNFKKVEKNDSGKMHDCSRFSEADTNNKHKYQKTSKDFFNQAPHDGNKT